MGRETIMLFTEETSTKSGGAKETTTTTTTASPLPIFAAAPLRSRRKSAKAAAAFVAATAKEQMLLPDYGLVRGTKRSYSRGNSQGLSVSAATATYTSNDGSSSHHATPSPCASTTAITPLKNCKGHPKKKTALSSFAVEYLKAWMMSPDHIEHPYPTEDEKTKIMKETYIELKQLTNWFVNNRKRYWKPKVEELRRQSLAGGVTLQDLAAQAQRHMSPAMVAAAVAIGSGATSGGCGKTTMDKRRRAGNGDSSSPTMMTTVISSEGEESLHSHSHSPKEQRSATVAKASMLTSSSAKKRKKYSVAADKVKNGYNSGGTKKTKANLRHGPVANPIVHPSPPATTNNQQQQSGVGFMAIGIHTANTYESVKAARKMSRTISEQDSDNEGESANERRSGCKSSAVVSNPLAAPLNVATANTTNSAVATIFTTTTKALLASVPTVNAPPIIPTTANSGGVDNTQKQQKWQPDLPLLHRPIPNANLVAMADLLDYSISPLDNQMVANTDATSQAIAASGSGFCCHVMPHDCNLADPMGTKNCLASPCALCSACRDWNLGEFCPWDLTGIIGDISTDAEMVPVSSASSSSFSSSSSLETYRTIRDNNIASTVLVKAASLVSDTVIVTTSTSSPQGNLTEEATTITRNLLTEVANVASIDEDTGSPCEYEYEEILKLPTAVPMMVGAFMTSSPSNASFLIPAETDHSTSRNAADFISRLVDIETPWDFRKSGIKRAASK